MRAIRGKKLQSTRAFEQYPAPRAESQRIAMTKNPRRRSTLPLCQIRNPVGKVLCRPNLIENKDLQNASE
jgi:hypothetical protein